MSEQLEFHPISEYFPLMPNVGEEWEQFVEDIRTRGIRDPILLHKDGRILDGRNRYIASLEADVPFCSEVFEGTDNEAFNEVISLNLHRRHLSESQRAMVARNLSNFTHGGHRDNPQTGDKSPIGGLTTAEAARRVNVSPRLVERARSIKDPDTIKAIERGDKTVGRAYDEIHGKRKHEPGYRKDRVIVSEEKDLIEAMDNGEMSPTAAYDELQDRIRNLPQSRVNKPRKLIPIEDFVREMIRRISSVVRTGRLDAIAESGNDLTDYQRRDTAMALRDMAKHMLDKADELWPEETTTLDEQEYESE